MPDGSGQTIALDEAGNDPSVLTDLDGFDLAMSLTTQSTETLYQQYGPASSIVSVYNQAGTNITALSARAAMTAFPRKIQLATGKPRNRSTSSGARDGPGGQDRCHRGE